MRKNKWKNYKLPKKHSNLRTVIYIFLAMAIGTSIGVLRADYVMKNNLTKTSIPNVKIVEVEKVVEKVVEVDKIPTYKLIMELNKRVDPSIAELIAVEVDEKSKKWQLPKKLILGIIHRESNFDVMAKSKVGALGLMQVYPKYHEDKLENHGITMKNSDLKKLYHIGINIDVGCEIFKEYFDANKGDLDETFHSYLSKNATEEHKNRYMNDILETYARLEFLEYKEETNGN